MPHGTGIRKERNAVAQLEPKHQLVVSRLLRRNATATEVIAALQDAGVKAADLPRDNSIYAYRKGRTHSYWCAKLEEADLFELRARSRALTWEALQQSGGLDQVADMAAYELMVKALDEITTGAAGDKPADERLANFSLCLGRIKQSFSPANKGGKSDEAAGPATAQRVVFAPLAIPDEPTPVETEVES